MLAMMELPLLPTIYQPLMLTMQKMDWIGPDGEMLNCGMGGKQQDLGSMNQIPYQEEQGFQFRRKTSINRSSKRTAGQDSPQQIPYSPLYLHHQYV
jgi:hypothetical protein